MGNCLRLLQILSFSDGDDDATLLDPGQAEDGQQQPLRRRSTDATDTDESDESPLLFRMLSRSGRRGRRNRSSETVRDTSRAEGSPSSGRRNRGSGGGSGQSRRARRTRTHAVAYRENPISAAEQNQILVAQRLGLIRHLPLVLWESKSARKPNTVPPSVQLTTTSNTIQPTSSSISTAPPISPRRSSAEVSTSTSTNQVHLEECSSPTTSKNRQQVTATDQSDLNQPPSYEKSAMPAVFPEDSSRDSSEGGPTAKEAEKSLPGSGSEKDELECTICMEDFEDGQSIRYLPCMHFYHQHCIDSWLMKSFTCPRCMEAVDTGIMNSFAEMLS